MVSNSGTWQRTEGVHAHLLTLGAPLEFRIGRIFILESRINAAALV